MKKLLLLLSMLIPLAGFGQGGITVSPPFNPANMGPIGVSGLIDSGTFALTLASSNGTVLFDVKSGSTEVIKVSDGFGQPNVHFVADEWEFGNGQASFQYPLIFWVTGAVGFDGGFGNGDTFITRLTAGGLQVGTTKGTSNGSLSLGAVNIGADAIPITENGNGDLEIGNPSNLNITEGLYSNFINVGPYTGDSEMGVHGDGVAPAVELVNTTGVSALNIGTTEGTATIQLFSDGSSVFPTATAGTNTTQAATTAFVTTAASNTLKAGSFSGTGTATTAFVVTIGRTMANTTYKVNVTPTSALSAAVFYVTSKSTTQFTVTYLAGLTGTVTFDWSVFP